MPSGEIVAAQHAVDTDMSRLIYGKGLAFAFAEWPLVEQLGRSLLRAGALGMVLPTPAGRANPQFTPRRLTLTLPGGKRIGTSQIDAMHAHGMSELTKRVGGLVGTFGYAMACDGTDRYQRAVVSWLTCPPDRASACLDVSTTGKEKKTAVWWAAATIRAIKGPLNPLPAARCTLGNFDGGVLYAFQAIEAAFQADDDCANLIANWCACHGHHLLMESMFDLDGFGETFDDVNKVVKYVRHHTTVRHIMDQYSPGKGYVRHCEARMASRVLVGQRFWELATACKSTAAVASAEWATHESELSRKDKAELAEIKTLILSEGLLARVRKKLDLCEFLYQQLRRVDSDDPTMGILYQMWLETGSVARGWHETRFAVAGAAGFCESGPDAVTLCTLRSSEASGRGSDHPWTAEEVVAPRWQKMYNAGSGMGGKLTALAHAVNPAFHADASVRDATALSDAYEAVKYRHGTKMAMQIWGQMQEYLDANKTSEPFVDADTGQRHRACNYQHEGARGLEGRGF